MRLLALDGGGTKTVALIADERGRILGWGQGGPSNLSFVSRTVAEAAIAAAIHGAGSMAGSGEPLDIAVCGGPVLPDVMASAVERIVAPRQFHYYPEAPCCLASGDGARFGAVVLAGTGCFEYAASSDGRTHRTDGFGTVVGDEGSAYYIAQQALISVARAWDRRGPVTALTDAIFGLLGAETVRQITHRIHSQQLPRHEIARLAPLVTELAGADAEAQRIVNGAAHLLAMGVLACIREVGLQDAAFDLVLCGGVFRAGRTIIEPLVGEVNAAVPGARALRPNYEPVYGALRLAYGHASLTWSEVVAGAFADSLSTLGAGLLVKTG